METLVLCTLLCVLLPIIKSVAINNLCLYQEAKVDILVNFIISKQGIPSYSVLFITQQSQYSNETVDHWLSYFGRIHPFISGDVKLYENRKTVIAIFLLCGSTKSDQNYLLHWINIFANRQQDRLIVVGKKPIIRKLWEIPDFNQLPHRWAYAIDSNEFMFRVEGKPMEVGHCAEVSKLPLLAQYKIGTNIRGRHLKISGWAHIPPYHFILEKDENGVARYDGSNVRLFHEASLLFNFTFELHSDDEASSYGILLENGSWTGMVGAVNSGVYDAGLYLGPSLTWFPMFDFAGSLSGAAVRFLTARPKSEILWQAFLYPFRITLWITLMILFILVLFFILALMTLAKSKISTKANSFLPIATSTTLTFKIALEQSATIPREVRAICGAWLIFSIIIGTAYKSQVMSSLTFPFTVKPPSTFRELAFHKEYRSILNNIGGLEVAYFQNNESQLINMIAKTLSYEPTPINCISKAVLVPNTVCIGWFPFLEYTVAEWASPDSQISSTYISADPALSTVVSVAFQKYSPFTNGFTPIITSFWESGIYKVWESNVLHIHKNKGESNYKANPNTPLNKQLKSIIENIAGGNGEKPLKISNLKMMFIVLAFGVCLGVTIFASEQIFFYTWKWNNSFVININIIPVQPKN